MRNTRRRSEHFSPCDGYGIDTFHIPKPKEENESLTSGTSPFPLTTISCLRSMPDNPSSLALSLAKAFSLRRLPLPPLPLFCLPRSPAPSIASSSGSLSLAGVLPRPAAPTGPLSLSLSLSHSLVSSSICTSANRRTTRALRPLSP